MAGKVETAVRNAVRAGERLPTPTGRGQFDVAELDQAELVLLLGVKQARTPVPWTGLEGVPDYLRGRGWVPIGGVYSLDSKAGSLDAYLKLLIYRATAGWVAVVLERAGVVEIDRERPAKVRLVPAW